MTLGGHATNIKVTIFKDGAVEVSDNGRGIPVEIPKGETQPAAGLYSCNCMRASNIAFYLFLRKRKLPQKTELRKSY